MILVTNDDGIHSKGILVLAKALQEIGDVFVVSPDVEKSAIAHSLTLHRPLRVEKIKKNFYAVDGTPADCVHLGINVILPKRPRLIVSGINKGGNLGDDIIYLERFPPPSKGHCWGFLLLPFLWFRGAILNSRWLPSSL